MRIGTISNGQVWTKMHLGELKEQQLIQKWNTLYARFVSVVAVKYRNQTSILKPTATYVLSLSLMSERMNRRPRRTSLPTDPFSGLSRTTLYHHFANVLYRIEYRGGGEISSKSSNFFRLIAGRRASPYRNGDGLGTFMSTSAGRYDRIGKRHIASTMGTGGIGASILDWRPVEDQLENEH
jgi:hypothetical protein